MSGETEKSVSGWTVDTLHELMQRQINDFRGQMQERFDTQTKAMEVAFVAADRAVQAALESAEKAVAKAETAADKRFDAVNEFRAQLADQAATLLSRAEYDAAHAALIEKVDSIDRRLSAQMTAVQSRLDLNQGQDSGVAALQRRVALGAGTLIALIGVAIAAAAFLSR